MRYRSCPALFRTGGTLSPRDINENLTHMETLLRDAQERRYINHVLRLPLQTSLDAPYTNASDVRRRTYSLLFPQRLALERTYFRFYGSGTAPVTVTLEAFISGSTPKSFLTVTPIASDGEHVAFTNDRLILNADIRHDFVVTGASFSSKASYLELHLRSDRFNTAGTDLVVPYKPALVRGGEARDADRIQAELAKIDLSADSLSGVPMRSAFYVVHDLASAPAVYSWPLAQNGNGNQRRLSGYRAWRARGTASSTPTSLTWRLVQDGVIRESFTLPSITSDFHSVSGSINRILSGDNWVIECESDSSSTPNVAKTTLQLFYN
jgi:hypothetical protein